MNETPRYLIYVLAILAAGVGVFLARQNGALEARNLELRRQMLFPAVGSFLPPVQVPAEDGDVVVLAAPGSTQVIFFFDTRYPFCEASMPRWKALAEDGVVAGAAHVVGVAIDSSHLVRSLLKIGRSERAR